jgi:hypothetical protein
MNRNKRKIEKANNTERSYEKMTVGELKLPRFDCESASNIPLGHVPGLTWSLSNECIYDIEFDDEPLTLSTSIKDGILNLLSSPVKT